MKTQSEAEAHDLLARARAALIARGFLVAVRLARQHGAVHAQMVWTALDRAGDLSNEEKTWSSKWLALVFKGRGYKDVWEPCGFVKIGNKTRNAHPAVRRLWRLRDEGRVDANSAQHGHGYDSDD